MEFFEIVKIMDKKTKHFDNIRVNIHIQDEIILDPDEDLAKQIFNEFVALQQPLASFVEKIPISQEILQPLFHILQPTRYHQNSGSQNQDEEAPKSDAGPPRFYNPLKYYFIKKTYMVPGDPNPYLILTRRYLFPKLYRDINVDCGLIQVTKKLAGESILLGRDPKIVIDSILDLFGKKTDDPK